MRGTRPGQRVKIHVDQARENESVGGGESARSGVRESRACSMTVVTRHPLSVEGRTIAVVLDVTNARFCRMALCCVLYPSARKGAGWAYSSVG